MSKLAVIARLVFLVAALGIVFAVMRSVTPQVVARSLNALGIATDPNASANVSVHVESEGHGSRSLCRTRISAIEFGQNQVIEEVKTGIKPDWIAKESGKSWQISYMEVEKWLAEHCQFDMQNPRDEMPKAAPQEIKIKYVDGSSWTLLQAGLSFVPQSTPIEPFSSLDLAEALQELKKIAGFKVDN